MNICYSGAAQGSDFFFGNQAGLNNHRVKHFSFNGHRNMSPVPRNTIDILSDKELELANPYLIAANKILKRHFPTSNQHTNKLLQRNYYQIRYAESIYAISSIDKFGIVEGGTSWAITMGILSGIKQIYVFDKNINKWMKFNSLTPKNQIYWDEIEKPPIPTGLYAGIGTRDLTETAKAAIKNLYLSST